MTRFDLTHSIGRLAAVALLVSTASLAGCKDTGGTAPPAECPAGTDGCPCNDDNTCGPGTDGVALACIDNVCQTAEVPDPGELNGPCDESTPCSTYEGQALDCIEGICQLPGCLSGIVGCPCGAGGLCDDPAADAAECIDGICQIEGCTPGTENCSCGDGGGCGEGLECVGEICRPADGVWIQLGDPSARACDVLLIANGATVSRVAFEDVVIGETMARGNAIAVSFTARADASLQGDVARVELDASVAGGGVTVDQAQCYDGLGAAITGSPISVR